MPADILVKVSDVIVPRKRMRVANHIEDLAGSIQKNGLLHAITLRRDGEKLILVAGRRRIEATKLLREGEIRARVLDLNETQALMVEIDENLQRAELTELQRAQHIAERKKVWEALHPQTRQGGAPGAGRGKKKRESPKVAESATLGDGEQTVSSFVEETSRQIQVSPRTVRVSFQIGEDICGEAQDLLMGTAAEDRKTDLIQIARMDRDEQVAVAKVIHDGGATTVLRAKKILEAGKIAAEPQPLPGGPFRVIVADPPWHYEKRENDASKRENTTYANMTIDDIKAMEVGGLAAEDAVLWLWTTNAHLPEAFAVARAWGFTYKTLLTWDKVRIGMGDWLRGQSEHCLFCAKGKPALVLGGQTTVLKETSRGHSEKPDAFYQLVESLCPGSKVELFARRKRDGWHQWGFEAEAS